MKKILLFSLSVLFCFVLFSVISNAAGPNVIVIVNDLYSNLPISGADVTVCTPNYEGRDPSQEFTIVGRGSTGGTGKALLTLPAGEDYRVHLFKSGYEFGYNVQPRIYAYLDPKTTYTYKMWRLNSPTDKMMEKTVEVKLYATAYSSAAGYKANRGERVGGAMVQGRIYTIDGYKIGSEEQRYGEKPLSYGFQKIADRSGMASIKVPVNAEIDFAAYLGGYVSYKKLVTTRVGPSTYFVILPMRK